jgi:hypothetical protein
VTQLVLVGLVRQAGQCVEQLSVACAREVAQQQIRLDAQQRPRCRREQQRRQRHPGDDLADRRVEQASLVCHP